MAEEWRLIVTENGREQAMGGAVTLEEGAKRFMAAMTAGLLAEEPLTVLLVEKGGVVALEAACWPGGAE
jgi:hypothetical protein